MYFYRTPARHDPKKLFSNEVEVGNLERAGDPDINKAQLIKIQMDFGEFT